MTPRLLLIHNAPMRAKHSKIQKIHMEFSLGVVLMKEGRAYVSYVPALDLSSHGTSYEDAGRAASEAAGLFLEELIQLGTLEEVLLGLGWHKKRARRRSKPSFSLVPPEVLLGQRSVNITCRA